MGDVRSEFTPLVGQSKAGKRPSFLAAILEAQEAAVAGSDMDPVIPLARVHVDRVGVFYVFKKDFALELLSLWWRRDLL